MLGLSVLVVLWAGAADAATLRLAWDANTESNIGGYVLDYGTQSGSYVSSVNVGNQTSYQFTNLTCCRHAPRSSTGFRRSDS